MNDNDTNLALDKSGNIKSWKICYCGWLTGKELLNPEKPFQTAYISAHSSRAAVEKLKRALRLSKIVISGEPKLETVSREKYENS